EEVEGRKSVLRDTSADGRDAPLKASGKGARCGAPFTLPLALASYSLDDVLIRSPLRAFSRMFHATDTVTSARMTTLFHIERVRKCTGRASNIMALFKNRNVEPTGTGPIPPTIHF
ncbi:hypothetical protein HAX54_040627, partial [Datura stramonium]|nr:hypothetical protein [Datura stramonium]